MLVDCHQLQWNLLRDESAGMSANNWVQLPEGGWAGTIKWCIASRLVYHTKWKNLVFDPAKTKPSCLYAFLLLLMVKTVTLMRLWPCSQSVDYLS